MEGQGMDASTILELRAELDEYLDQYSHCFKRKDTRDHLPIYICGQLSDIERKNVEAIALDRGVPVRTLQEFVSQLKWDEDCMRDCLQQMVAEEHHHEHSIGLIDETSGVKKGDKTPGVQRQYLGSVGKQENGIVTVHLGYAADQFHCLLDGDLFLPESWSNDRKRCREAGIPDEVVYRPKTDIALELYDRAKGNGVQFQWLIFDEWYGAKPQFLLALDGRGQKFVGEVHGHFVGWVDEPEVTTRSYRKGGRGSGRKTPRITAKTPQPRHIEDLIRYKKVFRDQPWQRFRVKDGQKGPQLWDVKHARIWVKNENGLPVGPWHLIVCRNVMDPTEVKYFVSNASVDTPLETLLLVAFSRWRVERCFEDQKGEVGLDHYEGRRYVGLKRHLIMTAVSYLFLSRVRERLAKKKSGMDRVPGAYRRFRPCDVLFV
jgi:SRSO17 transposase